MKKLITIFVLVTMCLASVSCNEGDKDSSSFPVQKAGVTPDEAVKGKLALVDGAFRVNQAPVGDSFLLVWPDDDYTRQDDGGTTLIIDPDGQTITQVGETVIVRGNLVSAEVAEKHVGPLLPEVTEGPYWFVKEVVSSLPEPGPLTQERINELAEIYRSRTKFFNWAVYAEEHGITMKEAIGRFSEVDDSGLLGSVLEELEGDTFSGLWLGGSGIVAAFTENGEETIKDYLVENSPLARRITLRTYDVSFNELSSAQHEIHQILEEHGLSVGSYIDVVKNRVVLQVTDAELFNDTLAEAGLTLPDYVVPDIIYEPADAPPPGINPDPSVHFPQLKTASASYMQALLTGKLTLKDGYLRVHDELIIWQPDYFVHNNEGTIEILDRDGKVVGRVGEEIYMGGGEIPMPPEDKFLKEPLPPDIEGPFWLQGGGTRLNLNFSSDLFGLQTIDLGEYNVYFLTRKPALDEMAGQETTITGSLLASYNGIIIQSPHIRVEPKPEENKGTVQYTAFWPAGYEARIENGVFEILDGSGNVVLRDGDAVEITGRLISRNNELRDELPGGYSGPYLIVERITGERTK